MTTVKEICGATIVDYKGAEHTCQRKKGHERFHLDNRDGSIAQWTEKDATKLAEFHKAK
jgi:hypothetical protein